MKNSPDGPVFCGSALSKFEKQLLGVNSLFYLLSTVSENYAVTAAHCFNVERKIESIYLLVGDHDISKGDDTPYAAIYAAKRIIKHSKYVPESDNQNNDIALVQTVNPISWKRTIGPACLPFIFTGFNGFETYFNSYNLVGKGWLRILHELQLKAFTSKFWAGATLHLLGRDQASWRKRRSRSPTALTATLSMETSTATRFARSRKVILIVCRLKHQLGTRQPEMRLKKHVRSWKLFPSRRNRLLPRRFRRKSVLDVQQPTVHNRHCELRHRMCFKQPLGQH